MPEFAKNSDQGLRKAGRGPGRSFGSSHVCRLLGEANDLRHLISDLRSKYDCGVLVIEHNMALVMNLCDRIQVLDSGRTIATGTAAAIRNDANVRRAYLGSTVLQ